MIYDDIQIDIIFVYGTYYMIIFILSIIFKQ